MGSGVLAPDKPNRFEGATVTPLILYLQFSFGAIQGDPAWDVNV